MKSALQYLFIGYLLSSILWSCETSEKVKFDSTGKINQLLLVMEDKDWKGALGDTVRKYFARDVLVLPQREPLFSINQIAPEVYDETFFILRNILMIEKGAPAGLKVLHDEYAEPQIIVKITGRDNKEISDILNRKADSIIKLFKDNDITVLQSRFRKKDLTDDSKIREMLGITIDLPNSFKKIVEKDGFFWYREDLPFGSKNILLYSVPKQPLESVAERITKIRDSIGKKYIPGPLPETWMVTEKSFAPVQQQLRFNEMQVIESRGLWEVENDYMGGPYLNYIIPLDDKVVIAEGFIYLPSDEKRNMLTELEAILKTIEPVR